MNLYLLINWLLEANPFQGFWKNKRMCWRLTLSRDFEMINLGSTPLIIKDEKIGRKII
jgi:hypothetical protein